MSVRELDVAVLGDAVARLLVDTNYIIPSSTRSVPPRGARHPSWAPHAIIDRQGRNYHEEARAKWRR